MAGDWLTNLTLITNFLCMAITMWFAIYLLARSPANPITFRGVVALLAMAFYYNNAFVDLVNSNLVTGPVRSLTTLIALIAAHNLTHYLLPLAQQKRLYWIERCVILMGVIAIVLLFMFPAVELCDPRYICPTGMDYPWIVIDALKFLFFAAILYNLRLIRKNGVSPQNVAFYEGILIGASTIAYGLLGTVMNLDMPRFIPNLVILAALSLLLYAVAHDQAFVTRRSSYYDLPITLLTITVIGQFMFYRLCRLGWVLLGFYSWLF